MVTAAVVAEVGDVAEDVVGEDVVDLIKNGKDSRTLQNEEDFYTFVIVIVFCVFVSF